MEKLTCSSCNGELELDEKHEIATCKYCGTKYKLDGKKTIVLNLDDVKMPQVDPKDISKAFIPVIVLAVGGFILVASLIVLFGFTASKKAQVSSYNIEFVHASGTQQAFFISDTLDKVNTKNKTNDKHKITVVYKDKETQNEDEINSIKHSLGTFSEYEVKISYDDDGYVNKITIEDIK